MKDYSTILKIVYISCLSWFVFLMVDTTAFYLYRINTFGLSSVSSVQELPILFYTTLLYLLIGLCYAVVLTLLYLCSAQSRSHPASFLVFSLSFCLASNFFINLYTFSIHPLKLSRAGTLIAAGIAFSLVLLIVYVVLGRCKKHIVVSLIAFCIPLESFWTVFRYYPQSMVYLISSFCFSAGVFGLLYFVLLNPSRYRRGYTGCSLFITVGVSLAGVLCSSQALSTPEEGQSGCKKPNVILIVMDTTRADHVSCYGYDKKTTPRLDAVANHALVYTNAYATASFTLPSFASILTGTYSGYHGADRSTQEPIKFNKLSYSHTTLAEVLSGNGYATAGISSCCYFSKEFGLHQGFDYYHDQFPDYTTLLPKYGVLKFLTLFFPLHDFLWFKGYFICLISDQVNDLALSWLSRREQTKPFFLLLHYYDPHNPYFPYHSGNHRHKEHATISERYGGDRLGYVHTESSIIWGVINGDKVLLPDERKYLLANYDGEISYTDGKIGEVLDVLMEQGIYEDSLIIITADHGESFGEHNMMLHGLSVDNTNIHVPLIVKYPAKDPREGTVSYPVSLTGIFPTILSYLSIPIPECVQGAPLDESGAQKIIAQNFRCLSWGTKGEEKSKRFAQDLIALVVGDYKYIKSVGGEDSLFNIRKDREETANLIGEEKRIAERLMGMLEGYVHDLGIYRKKGEEVDLDPKILQNLKALGYLQ